MKLTGWLATISGGIIVVAGLGGLLLSGVLNPPSSAATRTDSENPAVFGPEADMDYYQKALSTPDLSDAAQANYQEKLAMAQVEATIVAIGAANPAPKNVELAPMPKAMEDPPFPEGIIDSPEPLYKELVRPVNLWQGPWTHSDGQAGYVIVTAGSLPTDATQGVVVIERLTGDYNTLGVWQVLTPKKDGALKVLENVNGVITLQSTDGVEYHFNIQTETLE